MHVIIAVILNSSFHFSDHDIIIGCPRVHSLTK